MDWRVYYEDGTVFSSTDGPPEAAPGYGVLGIWQATSNHTLVSQDYYLYRDDYGCWVEVKLDGLIDHLVTAAPQVRAVKAGRTVPLALFKATVARMNEDRDGHR
jgi:hypothetical protein